MSMVDNDFWDKDEFEFFNQLDDSSKLLYIYDLMISDFDDEFMWGDGLQSEIWDEMDYEVANQDTSLFKRIKITAETLDDIKDIVDMMMMNGLIVTDSNLNITTENVEMTYTLLSKSNPICVN
jgi:hypothetical protein|tara:strand:+ start:202 stop:570 length:369 start_codon:yes stop_codon:yes gene_type:complete